jgi:hypothetical protein
VGNVGIKVEALVVECMGTDCQLSKLSNHHSALLPSCWPHPLGPTCAGLCPSAAGKRIHLSLLANPSHLEAVNTVAMGKVRGGG